MRRPQAWVLVLAAGTVATACANDADPTNAEDSPSFAAAPELSETRSGSVQISTSSWEPGDGGRSALIRGTLGFTPDGCPHLGAMSGVVWPAGFTSLVKPDGEQVIVTADGREISEGDTVIAGGAAATTEAEPGMPCIKPGTTLTLIQSSLEIVPSR